MRSGQFRELRPLLIKTNVLTHDQRLLNMDKPRLVRRVTVKTERTLVFRSHGSLRVEWCSECGADVGMTSVDGAARESGMSEMAIYKLVEARALHFTEDAEGHFLICLNSLRR